MFSRKPKYVFDPFKLSYVLANETFLQKILRIVKKIIPGFLFSFLFLFILLKTVNSPFDKKLNSNIDSLVSKIDNLNVGINSISKEIVTISYNDNNIYRPYIEMDTIPSSIRNAGFGGINSYENLKNYLHSDILIEVSENIDIVSKQLFVQSISYDDVIKEVEENKKMREAIPSYRPVKLNYIDAICSYGMRQHPLLNIYRMHKGVDLCAPENTEIYAAGDGLVTRCTFHESLGNYIVINHGYNYETVYGHLNKQLVNIGDSVKKGDLIALMGTTGISTISHLHYEVHKNGEAVNPMSYYLWDITEVEYNNLISDETEAVSFFMN